MTNEQLLTAIRTLLVQGQNNYHLSNDDMDKAKYALQVLNNIYKTAKELQNKGVL